MSDRVDEYLVGSATKATLILSALGGATWRYSCFHKYEQLRLADLDCELRRPGEHQVITEIERWDIVIFHRTPYDKYVGELIRKVHERGAIAIFSVDDLILNSSFISLVVSPDIHSPIRAKLYQDELTRYRAVLDLCDAVITPTPYLANQVRSFGKSAWFHRDAFSLELLSLSDRAYTRNRRAAGRVIIGYASGSRTHDRDFQEAKPALQEILCKYPETELWIIGPLNPGNDWGILSDRIKRIAFVPWRQLPALLAQFDINIAPLDIASSFCQAKCEVKYIEAGLVRVPTVASKTDAFTFAIRSGDNGFLATTHEDWVESLERLIGDAALRREVGEHAYADLLERYHPVVRGQELIATLNQISEKIRGRPSWPNCAPDPLDTYRLEQNTAREVIWLDPALEKHPSLVQRALYALRYRSPRIFLMQVLIYLQEQIAILLAWLYQAKMER
jgi:glycosyltransferase involved in cell wall biosynthesis